LEWARRRERRTGERPSMPLIYNAKWASRQANTATTTTIHMHKISTTSIIKIRARHNSLATTFLAHLRQ